MKVCWTGTGRVTVSRPLGLEHNKCEEKHFSLSGHSTYVTDNVAMPFLVGK